MGDLRITDITVHLVAWPLRMKRRHGVGDIEHTMPGVILRIGTDGGLVGWGEAAPWAVFTNTAEASAAAISRYFKPLLIGADPMRVTTLMRGIDKAVTGQGDAKAAVEMALLDIAGKRLGAPVSTLIGGRHRERIPLSVSIANPDFDEDLDFARDVVARHGVNIFKVKTGFTSHAEDMRRMARLKEALPATADIRVDYNQGLDPWDAIRQLKEIETFRPTFIEQPVKRHQRAAMAEITRALDTPIMADESVFDPVDAVELVRDRFAKLVSIKIMKAGGIARAREVAAITEAAGITAYGGTMFEAGLAIAAGLHLVSATPNIALGAEFYTSTFVMGVEILATPIRIEAGETIVPDGPGLGVEVDEDAVKRVSIAIEG